MSENIPQYIVKREPNCHADIGLWLGILQSAREGTHFGIGELTIKELDAKPPIGINTVGTLLYHIALTDLHWVYDNMLQSPYPNDIDHLFPFPLRNDQRQLFPISGWDFSDHMERLSVARVKVHEVFKQMSSEKFQEILRRETDYGAYEMTPEAVIRHLTLHETEHLGEMKLILGALKS